MLLSCLAGNLEKIFIEIYGDISKWLGTIFYNKNYNFLNATNKSKLIMVLEKLQIIISLPLSEIVCKYPGLAVTLPHSGQSVSPPHFVSLRILSLKGLTKSTVHTGAEPLSVLWDSLFFVCQSLKCIAESQSSDRYQILRYKYLVHFSYRNIYILCFK